MIAPSLTRAAGRARPSAGALLALAWLALLAAPASGQLTLRIQAPADTPPTADVFVAGSFNGWNPANPAYRLAREPSGEYAITLPPEVRGGIEFKFTRGSWEAVEVDSGGADVPNRRFTIPATGAATYAGVVPRWRDPSVPRPRPASSARATVTVIDTAFAIPQLGRTRRVWVYVPPDYTATRRRYPVLYMHDGQNLFDNATGFAGEWGVDETLDSLHAAGDPGVIVVAVDNGGTHRLDEYSPWTNPRYGGGEGDEYVDFLVHTLKPYIDAHFRTLPDRVNTGVAGSSMGGLISLYAVLRYPDVFGRAGVFSPAFWFAPAVFDSVAAADPPRAGTRVYLVTGGQEGNEPEVYAGDHRRMVQALAAAGFDPGEELEFALRPQGTHSEGFWRQEFAAAYLWLFRRGPNALTPDRI